MRKHAILLTIALIITSMVQAQDLVDVLRFSNYQVMGTARSGSMGNAFGALGGDFTSASINPAGLGLYRSGEFVVTPVSVNTNVESNYWGTMADDSYYNFSLNNISYVSAIPIMSKNEAGLVSVNIGLGYNRLKDFGSNSLSLGHDIQGSFTDHMIENADIDNWSEYYEDLAWETYVLNYDDEQKEYWTEIRDAGYGQSQRKNISKKGSMGEYSIAVGLNFNHKFYLGAGFGLTNLFYQESSTIVETNTRGNIRYFNEFQFDSYQRTNGYGSNFKIGAIYKPVNEIRLGVSVQTPTFYRLDDLFYTSMYSSFTYDEWSQTYDAHSRQNVYDYRMVTPMRTTFSGAFIIAKQGLISIDYELVSYGQGRLRNGGDGYGFVDENMDISEAFRTTGNLRLGGELRANKNVSLRGGLQVYPSAYKSQSAVYTNPNSDASLMIYSGGLGYRTGNFFFDAAYQYSAAETYEYLYPLAESSAFPEPELSNFKSRRHTVLFTVGFKF